MRAHSHGSHGQAHLSEGQEWPGISERCQGRKVREERVLCCNKQGTCTASSKKAEGPVPSAVFGEHPNPTLR